LLGSVPDNAFQRARVGESFDLQTRALAVILGGMKLFGVGFISSIGTLSVSNGVWAARKVMNPELTKKPLTKRSPIFKTAFVYGSFLGLSANLRYQVRFPAFPLKFIMMKKHQVLKQHRILSINFVSIAILYPHVSLYTIQIIM
jgi:hypothetical protein